MTQVLKDSATEVRVSLLENISKLASALGDDEIESLVIPEIVKLSQDKTWRVRLATIQFIPSLPKYMNQ